MLIKFPITIHGPIVPVEILLTRNCVAQPSAHSLQKGNALLDTGATTTCVDQSVVGNFNLVPTGNIRRVVSGNDVTERSTYLVRIEFPSIGGIDDVEVSAIDLKRFNGQIAIIGNDILKFFSIHYNGPKKTFSFGREQTRPAKRWLPVGPAGRTERRNRPAAARRLKNDFTTSPAGQQPGEGEPAQIYRKAPLLGRLMARGPDTAPTQVLYYSGRGSARANFSTKGKKEKGKVLPEREAIIVLMFPTDR